MLKISHATVASAQKNLLHDITLCLAPGSVHVLMGPNGAGKSSLMYTLMGHPSYRVLNGSIYLDGVSIVPLLPEDRAKSGLFMTFQVPPALPGVSVHMIMQEVLRARYGKAAFEVLYERTEKAVSALKIDRVWLYRPLDSGFSGGERKVLELVQLMILQPRYILLDELDAGLDVDTRNRVGNALQAFAQSVPETAWLMTSHQNNLLSFMRPDEVHIMCNGRIVCSGKDELVMQVERDGYCSWQQ